MKSGFKKHLWISVGIVLVAAVAAAAGLYYLSGDLTGQANKIVADKNLLAKQAAAVGILAELKNDAPQAAAYSAAMNQLLPTHDQLIGFSQWATALATSHNVSITFAFTGTNNVATPTTPGTDGFNMNATGASSDLVAFLTDLETQSTGYLLSIDSFGVTRNDPDYTLALQGRLFSQ